MNDKDDDLWLAALSGKPDGSADPEINSQAQAVRLAMLARREALDAASQKLDPNEFKRLQSRLEREGLIPNAREAKHWIPRWLSNLLPTKDGRVAVLPVWSLAANVVLAVVVVLQMGSPPPEVDVLRGDSSTVLRVTDPQTRLSELVAGLESEKARFVVQRAPEGEVILTVQADDAALDYLISQRISPQVTDGLIVIRLKTL